MNMSIQPIVRNRFICNGDQQPVLLDNDDDDASTEVEQQQKLLLGPVHGLDQASCLFSTNGVRSGNQINMGTIANLRNDFIENDATGIALEVWMTLSTLSSDDSQATPIVVIGKNRNDNNGGYSSRSGCPNWEVYIGIRGGVLEIQYSDGDAASSCRILVVREHPLLVDELTHVLLAINDDGKTNVYLNGHAIIQGARNNVLTNMVSWDPESTFTLFPSGVDTKNHQQGQTYFDGSLHQVSMYNQRVTEEQVASIYDRGLEGLQAESRDPLRLVAYSAANPPRIIQGQANSFLVGGLNTSRPFDYNVMVEIMSLPQFGSLLADSGPVSMPGVRLPLTGNTQSLPLFYKAWSNDYFNVPHLTYSGRELNIHPEFFSYRLIAVPADDEIGDTLFGWSETIHQELAVVHTNHPPSLMVPETAHIPEEQPDVRIGARPIALIRDVELKDPDFNIDRVRVDVWTEEGTLTIHEDVSSLADFDACRDRTGSRESNWNCHGTGTADRNMTFLAEPDDVSRILSNLEYKAFGWDQPDNITVRIYDGSGGPCLSDQEHQQSRFTDTENFFSSEGESETFTTIHNGCFGVVAEIVVPGISRNEEASIKDGKTYLRGFFEVGDFGAADILFWSVLGVVVCFGCLMIQSCIRCRLARGAKVYPDEADFGRNGGHV